jgi:hypothetical protein
VEFCASDSAQLLPTMPTQILWRRHRRAAVAVVSAARWACGAGGVVRRHTCRPRPWAPLHPCTRDCHRLRVRPHTQRGVATTPTHPQTRLLKPHVMPAPKMA